MNLLLLSSLLGALQVAEPNLAADACGSPGPILVEHSGRVARRLRGDWEIPDIVALTYSTAWPDALEHMLEELASKTRVLLLLPHDAQPQDVRAWLRSLHFNTNSVDLAPLAVDTGWVRDYGPLQTTGPFGDVIWLDADYSSRPGDDVVPHKLAERFHVPVENVPEGLEGGALISNGRKLCVSTIEAFDQNGISVSEVEAMDSLLEQLGCQLLVLAPALTRDPTKHANMFAQFLDPGTIALASFGPIAVPEYTKRMNEAAHLITKAAARLGFSLKVVRIPQPSPQNETYFTYLNGLSVGEYFLVPQYESVSFRDEKLAYEALLRASPGLRLVPIPSDEIIVLNGAVHCVALGLSLPRLRFASFSRYSRGGGGRATTSDSSYGGRNR